MAELMYLARVTATNTEVFALDPSSAIVTNEVHKTIRLVPRKPRAWRVQCHWLDRPRLMGCAIHFTATAAREAARRQLMRPT